MNESFENQSIITVRARKVVTSQADLQELASHANWHHKQPRLARQQQMLLWNVKLVDWYPDKMTSSMALNVSSRSSYIYKILCLAIMFIHLLVHGGLFCIHAKALKQENNITRHWTQKTLTLGNRLVLQKRKDHSRRLCESPPSYYSV